MTTGTTCDLCGTPVAVVSSGEGTAHYEPMHESAIAGENRRLHQRIAALSRVTVTLAATDDCWAVTPEDLARVLLAHRWRKVGEDTGEADYYENDRDGRVWVPRVQATRQYGQRVANTIRGIALGERCSELAILAECLGDRL